MAKLSIEDLKKIKESARGIINLRQGHCRVKVDLHMGACGIASGAREIMKVVMDEIGKRELQDVIVTACECAGLCSREPMITVEILGNPPVRYVEVTPDKMREIFSEHVLGGRVVEKYALAAEGEKTV